MHNVLRQLDGADAVQAHHVQFRVQIGFSQKTPYTDSGIDARDINPAIEQANLVPKLLDARGLCKVSTNRRDLDSALAKLGCSDV